MSFWVKKPAFHFTPPANWLNDPNGLVYHAGEYHLFYQHHPYSLDWGPMHWGHTVSSDLVDWQHLPLALEPDEKGMIFSGSAIIDRQNTAGFGVDAMVAIFTHHHERSESQSIAYSTDHGRTWTKFEGNPVIPAPDPPADFRDPKVFRHYDNWVMLLAAGRAVLIYTSPNLRDWTQKSRFSYNLGDRVILETPDLFELPLGGTGKTRWVLTIGVGANAIAGGSGTQYFIGDFDGECFAPDPEFASPHWMDLGPDFYAAQSWNDEPQGRRISIAWMNNWKYAAKIPAATWRGTLTLPRQLTLVQTDAGIRLAQSPIAEMRSLRGRSIHFENQIIHTGENLLERIRGNAFEMIAEIEIGADIEPFGFHLRKGLDEKTTITFDPGVGEMTLDRSSSGQVDFLEGFPKSHTVPLPTTSLLKLHIFVDQYSIEIFINGGLITYTANIFPDEQSTELEFFVSAGSISLPSLDFYDLGEKR